jgi:hypothetical protein
LKEKGFLEQIFVAKTFDARVISNAIKIDWECMSNSIKDKNWFAKALQSEVSSKLN